MNKNTKSIKCDGLDINYEITEEDFSSIIQNKAEDLTMGFVDGGSNIIYDKTTEINTLIYAGVLILHNNKIESGFIEKLNIIFKLVHSRKNQLKYVAEIKELHPLKINDLNFDLKEELKILNKEYEITSLNDINKLITESRRLLELIFVKKLNETNHLCILDGSLENAFESEVELLNKLSDVVAISKKTRLITMDNISLIDALEEFSKYNSIKSPWAVKIGKNITPIEYNVFMIKFTDLQPFIFRTDVLLKNYNFNEVLTNLWRNSKDGLVYGYPYGLVMIDHFARVSNDDARFEQELYEIRSKMRIYDLHAEFNTFY